MKPRLKIEKVAGAASIAGLSGLTALEGAGALNKEKSKKERALSGASAMATGSILADELHHGGYLKKIPGLLKRASWAKDVDSIKDSKAEYRERGHRAGKAGALLGTLSGLSGGSFASRKMHDAAPALARIGLSTLAGGAAGYAGGQGAHSAIYGHRKPKEKRSAPMSPMMRQHMLADASRAAKPAAQAIPKLRGQSQNFDASHFGAGSHEPIELASKPKLKMPAQKQSLSMSKAAPASSSVLSRIGKYFKGA